MANPFALAEIEPAAAAAPNPYSAQAIAGEQQDQLRASLRGAVATNPDEAAQASQLSRQTGAPVEAVQANLPQVQQAAKLDEYEKMLGRSPKTADFMRAPQNAAISHDDLDNLTAIEDSFRSAEVAGRAVAGKVGEPFQRPGGVQSSAGRVGDTFIRRGELTQGEGSYVGGLIGADQFRAIDAGMGVAAADALGLDPTRAIREYDVAKSRAAAAGPDIQSTTGRAIYGGLQSIVGNAPGMIASLLTMNPVPALAWAGLQQGGEAYGKYRSRGATPGQATVGAVGEGVTEIATEMLPMGFLVNKFGKAGAGEFITGLLAREMPGEQVATFVEDALDTAIANPDKTWGQFWRERPGAAYETAISTLVQSGVMAGAASAARNTVMRQQATEYDAHQALASAQVMQQVMQTAAASKVRERDAATFEGFMQSAAEDGPLEKVYINPAEMKKAGVDLTQLAAVAPSVMPQLEQALQTGTDVMIPTSELATRLPGSELEQSVLQHLKTDPGGFSQLGAQEYLQTQGETQRAEVERVLAEHQGDTAFKDSMRAVEANVMQQLHAANRFTDDVNAPYAAMWGSFFGVQAARLGTTPQELFDRFAPRIVAQDTQQQPARTGKQEGGGTSYVIADSIGPDGPEQETVRFITRPNGDSAILRGNGDVVDVSNMIKAGFTPERAIAQALGHDTTGTNVTQSRAEAGNAQVLDQAPQKSGELGALDKHESVLQSLLECLGGA